jgi:hypothetical protein
MTQALSSFRLSGLPDTERRQQRQKTAIGLGLRSLRDSRS